MDTKNFISCIYSHFSYDTFGKTGPASAILIASINYAWTLAIDVG